MIKKIFEYCLIVCISFIFFSCAASTGSRYEDKEKTGEEKDKEIIEDFDLTKYHAVIDVEEKKSEGTGTTDLDIWYDYPSADTTGLTLIPSSTSLEEGYRIEVFVTDNLDEANNTRSDIVFQTGQKNVYVIFDPPFYKVRVGDFQDITEADAVSFKISQAGYTDTRVVKDSINVTH